MCNKPKVYIETMVLLIILTLFNRLFPGFCQNRRFGNCWSRDFISWVCFPSPNQ